jgi:hypothetical protein
MTQKIRPNASSFQANQGVSIGAPLQIDQMLMTTMNSPATAL